MKRLLLLVIIAIICFVPTITLSDKGSVLLKPLNTKEQKTQINKLAEDELYWLTLNIYHEARNESKIGKYYVGIVTLNRVHNRMFPSTIKEVVTQKHQFSWYWDGKSDIPKNKKAWLKCRKVSEEVLSTYHKVDPHHKKILYFHEKSIKPKSFKKLKKVIVVDNHIFYKI